MLNLDKFKIAQEKNWKDVTSELKRGYKKSPWMDYVFPVLAGSSYSSNSSYFALKDKNEVNEYLADEYLYNHMKEAIELLNNIDADDAYSVFNYTDADKLQASMTLFYKVSEDEMFVDVINKFFGGNLDTVTANMLEEE